MGSVFGSRIFVVLMTIGLLSPAAVSAEELTDAQKDYASVAATVACYNKRISDGVKANQAIEHYLESEGLTVDEYKQMETEFKGNGDVQKAIKDEMELCPTKVLAMPGEGSEETSDDAEEEEVKKWSYRER